jgi:hypothetical protein
LLDNFDVFVFFFPLSLSLPFSLSCYLTNTAAVVAARVTTDTIAKSWSFRLFGRHHPFTKVGLLTPSQVVVIVTLVVMAI